MALSRSLALRFCARVAGDIGEPSRHRKRKDRYTALAHRRQRGRGGLGIEGERPCLIAGGDLLRLQEHSCRHRQITLLPVYRSHIKIGRPVERVDADRAEMIDRTEVPADRRPRTQREIVLDLVDVVIDKSSGERVPVEEQYPKSREYGEGGRSMGRHQARDLPAGAAEVLMVRRWRAGEECGMPQNVSERRSVLRWRGRVSKRTWNGRPHQALRGGCGPGPRLFPN